MRKFKINMFVNTEAVGSYTLVILAGLFVHACFQLSLSLLLVIDSHAIGAHKQHSTVLKLSISYIIGALISTTSLLALTTYFFRSILPIATDPVAWVLLCMLVFSIGLVVLLFYYRHDKGTQLWIPRRLTNTLTTQAKRTHGAFGAFRLGLIAVLIELPFLIAPLAVAGAVLSGLPATERSIGLIAYAIAATMPLVVVIVIIGGGHKISTIQRWRETNKQFLQWTSGITLLLIGAYLFAINIWGQAL